MNKISNWLLGAWMTICSVMQIFPDVAMQVWMVMPDDMKDSMHPYVVKVISYSVLVMSMLLKMHLMRKENKALKNGDN